MPMTQAATAQFLFDNYEARLQQEALVAKFISCENTLRAAMVNGATYGCKGANGVIIPFDLTEHCMDDTNEQYMANAHVKHRSRSRAEIDRAHARARASLIEVMGPRGEKLQRRGWVRYRSRVTPGRSYIIHLTPFHMGRTIVMQGRHAAGALCHHFADSRIPDEDVLHAQIVFICSRRDELIWKDATFHAWPRYEPAGEHAVLQRIEAAHQASLHPLPELPELASQRSMPEQRRRRLRFADEIEWKRTAYGRSINVMTEMMKEALGWRPTLLDAQSNPAAMIYQNAANTKDSYMANFTATITNPTTHVITMSTWVYAEAGN